jgi:hypothetical protein
MAKMAERSEADAAKPQAPAEAAPAAAPIADATPADVSPGDALRDATPTAGPVGNTAQGGLLGGALARGDVPVPAGADGRVGERSNTVSTGAFAGAPATAPALAEDAVAQVDDADELQTGGAGGWGGVANTAAEEVKEEVRTASKMAARAPAPAAAPPMAQAESLAAPKQSADAAPGFDANAVIAAASKVASTDPMGAARQLEPFIRQGTAADGQRIALAAARYARDAGDLDKAESLARAGLARGGSGPDSARLTALISAIAQTRAADQAAPNTTGSGN